MGQPGAVRDYCEAVTTFVAKRGPGVSGLVATTVTGWRWEAVERVARAPRDCHTYPPPPNSAPFPNWSAELLGFRISRICLAESLGFWDFAASFCRHVGVSGFWVT